MGLRDDPFGRLVLIPIGSALGASSGMLVFAQGFGLRIYRFGIDRLKSLSLVDEVRKWVSRISQPH
jgi:hypothetical protein